MDIIKELGISISVALKQDDTIKLGENIADVVKKAQNAQDAINNIAQNLSSIGISDNNVSKYMDSLVRIMNDYGDKGKTFVQNFANSLQSNADITNEYDKLQKDIAKDQDEQIEKSKEANKYSQEATKLAKELNELTEHKLDLETKLQQLKEKNDLTVADKKQLTTWTNDLTHTNRQIASKQPLATDASDKANSAQNEADKLLANIASNQKRVAQMKPTVDTIRANSNLAIGNTIEQSIKGKFDNAISPSGHILDEVINKLQAINPLVSQIASSMGVPVDIIGSWSKALGFVFQRLKSISLFAVIPVAKEWIMGYTEEWRKLDKELALFSDQAGKGLDGHGKLIDSDKQGLGELQEKLMDVANDTNDAYADVAHSFISMKKALGNVTQDDDKIVTMVKNLRNAFDADEMTDRQAKSAEMMLSRMMSMKSVSGLMLDRLISTSEHTAKAIADGMGTTIGGLRAMANEHPSKKNPDAGLTGKKIFEAIQKSGAMLQAEADKMPFTWSKAFNLIRNAALEMFHTFEMKFGIFDKAKHFLDQYKKQIQDIAQWIREVKPENLMTFLKMIGVILVSQILRNVIEWVRNNKTIQGQYDSMVNRLKQLHFLTTKIDEAGNAHTEITLLSGFKNAGSTVKNFFKKIFNGTAQGRRAIQGYAQFVQGAFQKGFKTNGGIFAGLFQGGKAAGIGGLANAFKGIKSLGKGLLGMFRMIGGAIKAAFAAAGIEIFLLILEDIFTWMQGGNSIIGTLLGSFNEFFDGVSKGEGIFGTLWKAFYGAVRKIAYYVGFAYGVFVALKRKAIRLWEAIGKAWDDYISGPIQRVGAWVSELVAKARDFLNTIRKAVREKNAQRGIVDSKDEDAVDISYQTGKAIRDKAAKKTIFETMTNISHKPLTGYVTVKMVDKNGRVYGSQNVPISQAEGAATATSTTTEGGVSGESQTEAG